MYYPAVSIPENDQLRYDKYGRMRCCYLQEHRALVYHDLLFHVKLTAYLTR